MRNAGYSFTVDGGYVHIICKTFHDGVADEVMLSKKFSSCLLMKKVHTVQIWSMLPSEPVKNLRKIDLFVPYKGKVMAFNMSSKISKHCPDLYIRKLFHIHFGLESEQLPIFNLDDKTIQKDVNIIMSIPLTLET